jgi:cell division septation protein DedD
MDNLRFRDFLVGVRYLFCLSACILMMSDWQSTPASAADRPQLAQQGGASPTANIQKVQRLLKLLADRNPEQYGSVDPGRLDGVNGEETKIAIRNFRAIAGVTKAAVPDSELYTAVLSELARMAADDPDNAPAASPTAAAASDAPDTLPNGDPKSAATAGQVPAATPVVKAAAPAAKKAAATPAPANAAPAPASTVPRDTATSAESTQAPAPALLYFVQVASLRSVESAEREWERIKGENRAALQGEQTYLERVDLRNRGIFHRILIGPMRTKEEAVTLCGYLKQNDQTCVVTQRRSADINKLDYRKLSDNETGKAIPPLPWETPAPDTAAAPTADVIAAPRPPARTPAATTEQAAATSTDDAAGPDTPAAPTAGDDATAPQPSAADPVDPEKTFAETPAGDASPDRAAPQAPTASAVTETPSDSPQTVETPTVPPVTEPTAETATTPEAAPAVTNPAAPPTATPAPPRAAAAPPSPAPESPTPTPPAPRTTEPPAAAAQADSAKTPNTEAAARTDAAATADKDVPVPTAAASDEAKPEGGLYLSAKTLTVAAAAAIVLAIALVGGFFFHRRFYRARQPAAAIAAAPASGLVEASPLSAMEDEKRGELESLVQLEEAFDSPRLRESRRIRDEFLRDVLDDDPDNPSEIHKRDSAIRVNSSLKELLATDPEQYKSIFLSLIFLSKVGAALNRSDIAIEELNGRFSREFMLLQSYFKIHILELDDRHRIRQELPGLFYCLQLSQLQKRQGKRRFSAA